MVLLLGNRQLEILSQCVTIGPFDYGRTVGGGISVRQPGPQPQSKAAGLGPAPVQCARALSPDEQALPRVLLAARKVTPTAGGRATLSGPGGSLVIRRPSGPLSNPRRQVPPPRLPSALGAWRVLSIDGRSLGAAEQIELLLRPHWIEWRSGCVNEARILGRGGDGLMPGETDPFPVCERGRSPAELAMERLTAGAIATRMTPAGLLTLTGSGVTVELVPLTA